MVVHSIGSASAKTVSASQRPVPAKAMGADQRRDLATRILAGKESASQAAREHLVSRKFVAQQVSKAKHALNEAFAPPADAPDDLLFWLPVTKSWIRQATLGLALTCHSSERGIVQFFRDHFDHSISVGAVHNTLAGAVDAARTQNAAVDLKDVRIGALDEIFQAGRPVLTGADVDSTYCFLLSAEDHRDGDTWGVRLLELKDRHFNPQATIADFGSGLRAGVAEALPDRPCRGDTFHALFELGKVLQNLENRAHRAMEEHRRLRHRQAKHTRRNGRPNMSFAHQAARAQLDEQAAVNLYDDVKLLADWLRFDILAVAGPCYAERQALFDFSVAELRQRQSQAGDACRCIVTLLANHRDELLAFAQQLDRELVELAHRLEVDPELLRDVMIHQAGNPNRPGYWQREADLRRRACGRLHLLHPAVRHLRRGTVRASSIIENLNSRLRGYFFLRRHLGPGYLELLQFYLNHRPYPRSNRPERKGRSPRELLTGTPHSHWLELLGHQRFRRL